MGLEERIEKLSQKKRDIIERVVTELEKKEEDSRVPIGDILGLKATFLPDGGMQMSMPIRKNAHNTHGMTHGGLIAMLADESMGYLVNKTLKPDNKVAVTSDIQVRYIAPGLGEYLVATPKVINKGNRIVVMSCEVHNNEGKLIALATANFYATTKR